MAKNNQNPPILKRISTSIGRFFGRIWRGVKAGGTKARNFTVRRPFVAFFLALLVLVILIILGNTVFKSKPVQETPTNPVKQVHTFNLGTSPKVTVQAKAEKSGVVQIVAQTGGIVNAINVNEGDSVYKGQTLINLATNYQGGNVLSLSRQVAENQYKLSEDTYTTQKENIESNRQVAEKTDANNDQLRDIQNRSLDESRQLLDLNESIAANLRNSLSTTPDPATEGQLAQVQAGINQLRSGIRSTEYQSASDRPPAELSNLQREITLKQLDIQEKSLDINRETAKLQYQIAAVNEANMYPATPFAGTVERVFVRVGQNVTSGTVLATITASAGDPIKLDALVNASVAKNISTSQDSLITVNGKTISMHPQYVSSEATSNGLYSVIYILDDTYSALFTEGNYVSVQIPVGAPDSSGITPFVPVDSVFQTQDESYVFVVKDNHATAKKVRLGTVQGQFVSVEEGLGNDDQVITDRNVVEGDQVQVTQ